MFDVGFWELALISVVALLIIGPERLPEAARVAGLWVGKGRRMLREVKADINRELREQNVADIDALKKDIQSAGEQIKDAAEEVNESVDAQGIGDSLKETFEQASPLSEKGGTASEDKTPSTAEVDADTASTPAPTTAVPDGYFYIYENSRTKPHKAVIHIADCAHCNDGQGRGKSIPKNAQWHGPFITIEIARDHQAGMTEAVNKKECPCVARAFASPPVPA